MSEVRLSDLLDVTVIQKMADAHYRAAGMPIGIIDATDGSILVGSGWQEICVKFHRANPVSLLRCRQSDNFIKDRLVEGEACHYKCQNGLWDIGVPIVVAGDHLATMFLGQFFYEGEVPDRAFFVRQAHEFGFQVDDYLAALDKVPVFTREKVDYILEYDKALVSFIADVAGHSLSRIKANEAIRESERKFHALFDQAFQFLGLLSTDGRVLEANGTALSFSGVTAQDVIGRPFWETVWWAHSPELQEKVQLAVRQAANGEFMRFEATHVAADGALHYIDFSLKPVTDESGKVTLLIPEGRDITERKHAEEEKLKLQDQLALAQKMESVGRLAGGVAHDFNNMLGVILGHAELALTKVGPTDPLAGNLEEIRKAAQSSAELTRQLLAFARKQTIAPMALELNQTVETMLKMLRRLTGENIEVVWWPGRDLWQVKIDPAQIDQILMNLVANARDAFEGAGKITIETSNVIADEAYCAGRFAIVPGEYVMLAVSDNGCGMDRETLANIFEPFYTTKQRGKGTGLGLAMVYGIVKQNHGVINVYSEPGRGTTFKIYLPRFAGKTAHVSAQTPTGSDSGGSETVLLVEDEAMFLKLAQTMLEKLGYAVLTAASPGEAIRLAAGHVGQIHLLMTDVVMPEIDGRDLARQMVSRYPNLKHLYMSGYTANVIAHHGVLEEGVQFIQKPFSMKELAAKVRVALDQH